MSKNSQKEAGAAVGNSHGNNRDAQQENTEKTGSEIPVEDDPSKVQEQPEPPEPMTPEEKVEALEAELAEKTGEWEAKILELNDQFLRKAADFENFRKRLNREKQEISEFANQNLLLDLVSVIDDFERAIKSAETSKDFPSFHQGIAMIEKGLSAMLENKWGLKRFDSLGEPFDPNRHEALQMEKSPDVSEAVVKEEYIKGYFLKERVIRFAKVKVCMPVEGKETSSTEAG